jgi:MFS family permease
VTRSQRLTLIATILGSAVVFLDATVVNVALPSIGRELDAGLAGQQWVLEARALQGVAGALLVPGSLAIVAATFGGEERGKAVGTWTAWTGIATVFGPTGGGLLVGLISWRAIFWVNIPISAHFGARLDSELASRPIQGGAAPAGALALSPAAESAVEEAKEQPLGVPDTGEVGPAEAPRIVAASTEASTSAFHLGALLAGCLMILGGIVSGVGIHDRPRVRAPAEDAEARAAPAGDGNADGAKTVDLAPHG